MSRPDLRPRRRIGALRRFLSDQSGGAVMMFSLMLPGLVGIAGAAVDYSRLSNARMKLQTVADAAALAAAREFRLGNTSLSMVTGRADGHARAGLSAQGLEGSVSATGDNSRRTVTVDISARVQMTLMNVIGFSDGEVRATATARMVGGSPLCVIALDTNSNHSLLLQKSAKLEAPGCAIYSNSRKPRGLVVRNEATMRAAFICSAGGRESPEQAATRRNRKQTARRSRIHC